jgi:hypothetical protein
MSPALARPARLIAAAAIPLLFVAAQPVADGMTYEFVMKTTSKQTKGKESVTMRGRGTYAGDDAKIEIVEASASSGGEEAFGGKGTYFIVKDAGKEMFLVNPKEKTVMKWDIANMFAGMSKLVNAVGGLVKMQMSDIKIDAKDMGAGPTVQGYPTRHIRMVQNYTVTASVFGRKSANKSESTTDYYFVPTLRIANPFVSNSQQMAMLSQLDMFNNPDYKNQLAAANAKMPKTGVPIRTVTVAVSIDDKGKADSTTSTMEMLNFKASNVPASEFAIPANFTTVEMPDFSNMPSTASGEGVDSAKAGPNAKDAAKEGAKAGAKEAAKAKLRGIFKKN